MQISFIYILSFVVTYFTGGSIGYFYSRRIKLPVSIIMWIVIVAATIFSGFIGINTALISIMGFTINLNWCLQSFGIGVIIRLLLKTRKLKSSNNLTA